METKANYALVGFFTVLVMAAAFVFVYWMSQYGRGGEMAQLALHYAMDPLTEEHDADKAVAILFRSAGYQKRSYIRKFIPVVERLGETLQFIHEIPRALGLARAGARLALWAAVRRGLRFFRQAESAGSKRAAWPRFRRTLSTSAADCARAPREPRRFRPCRWPIQGRAWQ